MFYFVRLLLDSISIYPNYISRECRRREMYSGHGRLCVCPLSNSKTSARTRMNGRGCPLVVHYWADLQSVHDFGCCNNIAPNAKYQLVFVLALCLVKYFWACKH